MKRLRFGSRGSRLLRREMWGTRLDEVCGSAGGVLSGVYGAGRDVSDDGQVPCTEGCDGGDGSGGGCESDFGAAAGG